MSIEPHVALLIFERTTKNGFTFLNDKGKKSKEE